jgi:hypothetical protein
MKADIYTKVVLTVIALCLLRIAAYNSPLISKAEAQGTGQVHVWIDGSNGYALEYAGPIAVKQ